MKPAYDITQRRNFGMPRRTFQVLTLNGLTTVAVHDDGESFFLCSRSVTLVSSVRGRYFEKMQPSARRRFRESEHHRAHHWQVHWPGRWVIPLRQLPPPLSIRGLFLPLQNRPAQFPPQEHRDAPQELPPMPRQYLVSPPLALPVRRSTRPLTFLNSIF